MDEGLLEVRDHEGEGYRALIDSSCWRVAILRFEEQLLPERQNSMERHLETDEVFVLTKGRGMIILGGNASEVDGLDLQVMEIGKVYNIRKNAWHTVSLSRDASVLIVENRDTDRLNSQYANISEEQQRWIVEAIRRESFEYD